MIVVNEDKIKARRKSIASKMRIPPHLLMKLGHMGGKIGKAAVALDSWQSRHFDKGKGIYQNI